MIRTETTIRVRYRDTDQMGVVYNGVYFEYFETGRTEMLRALGMPYSSIEQTGVMLPVLEAAAKFHLPARYDDLLTIRTTFKSQESVKLEFDCEIRAADGTLLTTAYFLLVFVDVNLGRPVPPPPHIREIILKLED